MRTYLREKRRREAEVFIPLTHWAGEKAQVDFFAVSLDVDGERREAHLLQFSLPYSDHDFTWVYEREDLPSFLDGHVRAFEHLGGDPVPNARGTDLKTIQETLGHADLATTALDVSLAK